MRLLALILALAACSDRSLPVGAADLAVAPLVDLASVRDLTTAARDLTAPLPDLANACEAAGGYCAPGDFAPPMCKSGWHRDDSITMAHPGVCGLGICCIADDCRTAGCAPGSNCQECLGPNGTLWLCLGNGSVC
jgi:hypothetical protein